MVSPRQRDCQIHLWAHHTQDDARNRQGNLYFTGDTICSYGSHFPIARHVKNDSEKRAVLFTTATYSVTTSGGWLTLPSHFFSSPVDPVRGHDTTAVVRRAV
jgi:hypothetical protein